MNKKAFFKTVLFGAAMTLFLCGWARAEQRGTFFELGVGGGIDLHNLGAAQGMIVPAVSIPLGKDIFRLRVEGDIEVINLKGKTMLVGGVAPMVRVSKESQNVRPFMEIGGGVNYASEEQFGGRHLGGPAFFSAMGGLGIEMPLGQRIISISWRARHLSNGHIFRKGSNQGYNSQYLMLSSSF